MAHREAIASRTLLVYLREQQKVSTPHISVLKAHHSGLPADMASEELLFSDGFTLMDAMSAFEVRYAQFKVTITLTRCIKIGEPRMDSGMQIEQDAFPQFDPLTPLLPEELCWMLDRTFACEVNGNLGLCIRVVQCIILSMSLDGMACRQHVVSIGLHVSLRTPTG